MLTPALLEALRGGKRLYVSWSPWASGGRREEADVALKGFGAPYDRCTDELLSIFNREGASTWRRARR